MNSNKSILHVVNIYFALPYFIGDQFLYLNDKGYDLHVICSPSEHLKEYSKKQSFKYLELPILRSFSIIQDTKSLFQICKYIKYNKIETIVGHTPKGALLAMIAGYITKVPNRIYFRHGLMYETSIGLKRKILILMERITSFCAKKIVCVSPSVAQISLIDKLNDPSKQFILGKGTCGGIDALNKFNPDNIDNIKLDLIRDNLNIRNSDFVIGYCGRLVRDKGIVELVTAFNQISSSKSDCKLLLVGDFEERDALPPEIIEIIEKDKRIIKTGFIYNDIEYYYKLMSLYVLASYREGFPISVLEASAMQLPILTTKVTGCIDSIIEGYTGEYVLINAESILQGILKIQTSTEIIQMGNNGRNFVLKYFDNHILWPIIEKELYT